jgi:hypothetical protein
MMLDAAVSLSNLVRQQGDMNWENADKVEAYIAKLKQHTDQLARSLTPGANHTTSSYNASVVKIYNPTM